jgi:Pyridoxal-phosphate dependent enzyme
MQLVIEPPMGGLIENMLVATWQPRCWRPADRLVVPMPPSAPKDLARAERFASDDRSLVWATDRAIFRWDFAGTGAVTPIYQAASRIEYVTIADLTTGKTALAPSSFSVVLAPSGERLAIAVGGVLLDSLERFQHLVVELVAPRRATRRSVRAHAIQRVRVRAKGGSRAAGPTPAPGVARQGCDVHGRVPQRQAVTAHVDGRRGRFMGTWPGSPPSRHRARRRARSSPRRRLVCHSSGNHAQALALAARIQGIPAYIVMPSNAPDVKRAAVAGYGGLMTWCEPTLAAREATQADVIRRTGAVEIHPYNDARIIAGQGTAALELLTDVGDLDVVMARPSTPWSRCSRRRAFRYRNFQNFRIAILFRCGGMSLYPATHPKPG